MWEQCQINLGKHFCVYRFLQWALNLSFSFSTGSSKSKLNKSEQANLPWATVGTSWFFGLVWSGGQTAAGGASTSVEFPEIKKHSSVRNISKKNTCSNETEVTF